MPFRDRLDAARQLCAALASYRACNALVLAIPRGAVPVAARESLALIQAYADQTVCLEAPAHFGAVSAYYRSFPQVDDAEVVRLLAGQEAP